MRRRRRGKGGAEIRRGEPRGGQRPRTPRQLVHDERPTHRHRRGFSVRAHRRAVQLHRQGKRTGAADIRVRPCVQTALEGAEKRRHHGL